MQLRSAAILTLGLLAAVPSNAEPMRVLEVSPDARTFMDGSRQEFTARFNAPVNHAASRLAVLRQDGTLVRNLAPRLGASPDTLYVIAGGLTPGLYRLR